MSPWKKVNIELSGITSTSTYPDGEMISLVNLRKKGGALEPVSPRKEKMTTAGTYAYIFHHNLPQGGVNILGYRDGAAFMVLEDGTESSFGPIIQGLVEFKSMAQIGNVVSVLDDNGIKYLLWENSTYKLVSILSDGSSPDLTSLVGGIDFKVRTFYTPDTSDISPSHSVSLRAGCIPLITSSITLHIKTQTRPKLFQRDIQQPRRYI